MEGWRLGLSGGRREWNTWFKVELMSRSSSGGNLRVKLGADKKANSILNQQPTTLPLEPTDPEPKVPPEKD